MCFELSLLSWFPFLRFWTLGRVVLVSIMMGKQACHWQLELSFSFFLIWEGCFCFQMIPREHDYRRFICFSFLLTFWFFPLLWLFCYHFFLAGSKDIALYLNHTFMLD